MPTDNPSEPQSDPQELDAPRSRRGRPEWRDPEGRPPGEAYALAVAATQRKGATDMLVAEHMGIGTRTIEDWRRKGLIGGGRQPRAERRQLVLALPRPVSLGPCTACAEALGSGEPPVHKRCLATTIARPEPVGDVDLGDHLGMAWALFRARAIYQGASLKLIRVRCPLGATVEARLGARDWEVTITAPVRLWIDDDGQVVKSRREDVLREARRVERVLRA